MIRTDPKIINWRIKNEKEKRGDQRTFPLAKALYISTGLVSISSSICSSVTLSQASPSTLWTFFVRHVNRALS